MLEIILALCIVGLLKLRKSRRNASAPVSGGPDTDDLSGFHDTDDDPVHKILKDAYTDLKRQRAGACGPWLASILDGGTDFYFTGLPDEWGRVKVERVWRNVDPAVALTAVRFTIDELAGGRYDLSGLLKAEAALMQLEAGE